MELVLITGGAGFIGSHLADRLLAAGYRVQALDNLSPQVHGPGGGRPEYLSREVDLRVGDVRDPAAVRQALAGQAIHVGSGRSFTILEVARRMAEALGCGGMQPEVTGQFRKGDTRHCFADISLARETL